MNNSSTIDVKYTSKTQCLKGNIELNAKILMFKYISCGNMGI